MASDYSALSTPPIFADFGASQLDIDNLFVSIETNSSYSDGDVYINVLDVDIGIDKVKIDYDGVSDMSILIS